MTATTLIPEMLSGTFLHEGERLQLSILFANCPWTVAVPYWASPTAEDRRWRSTGQPFLTDVGEDPHYFRSPANKTGEHEQLLRSSHRVITRLTNRAETQLYGRGTPVFVLLQPDGRIETHCSKLRYAFHGRWRP